MNPNNLTGLTTAEVEKRVVKGLVNSFKDKSSRSVLGIILKNVLDLPNMVVFICVGFLVLYGQNEDALLISGVMFVNILVSVVQEIQARNSLKKINLINQEPVRVLRNGELQNIAPKEIVQDDVLYLEGGNYLHVEGKLITQDNLLLDESIITGESDYIAKHEGDELLSGSFAVTGRGYYQATKVGENTFVNQVNKMARSYISYLSPLQKSINQMVLLLTYVTLGVIALLLSLNYFVLKLDNVTLFQSVISVVNAMVPQGIVLTLTLAFTLGVVRMYRQKILVQTASSIEALAGINVLCMDKTGTLTANKLVLKDFDKYANLAMSDDKLLSLFCYYTSEKNKTIIALTQKFSKPSAELTAEVEILEQLPFNSKTKASGLRFNHAGETYTLLLGSVDSLGDLLPEDKKEEITHRDRELADHGRRNLIMLGTTEAKAGADWLNLAYKYLPVAFLSLSDELRDGARGIILSFHAQDIKPIIISGDSAQTVLALVKQLDVPGMNRAISGAELAEIQAPGMGKISSELAEAVLSHDIFARVTPEQKFQIVSVFQQYSRKVAMLGDGVNDALAIKQANLGISMATGANVTKNIADVVLMDDDLQKLAAVMAEGKEILYNTLRSGQLLFVKNFYSLIIILGALALGLSFPFTPRGLFLLAFLNANIPVIVILAERNLNLKKVDFMHDLVKFVLVGGLITSVIGLGILIYGRASEISLVQLQTQLLVFLVLTGASNAIFVLNRKRSFMAIISNSKTMSGVLIILALIGSIQIPLFRDFLQLVSLGASEWIVLGCLGLIYIVLLIVLYNKLGENKSFNSWIDTLL